jgi:hypothetical protein
LELNNPFCHIQIQGPGARVLTISANQHSRVFDVSTGTSVEIDDLSIAGGSALMNSGGGIFDAGALTMNRSSISASSATVGGGITVNSSAALYLNNCTVSGNSATSGAGIDALGVLTVVNSTIADNTATSVGGGIVDPGGPCILTNVTVSGNRAAQGGGISGAATLRNTIVAGNFQGATTTPDDINGTVTAGSSNNVIGAGGSGGLVNGTAGNQVGVSNPGLSALGNWGGPTPTFALMFGSPAYNNGSNSLIPSGITTDQRGLVRIFGGTVDVGAYESQPPALAGDVNHDSTVSFSDLLLLAQNYGKTNVPMYELGDLTGDGKVAFADLLLLAQNYGHSSAAASAVAQASKRRH